MPDAKSGDLVGPYRLDAQIGAGGMGAVWLAVVEGAVPGVPVGERVALKIVHPHLVVEADVFERFVREADLGRLIRHQNVVRTLDAGMDVGDDALLVYLAMEYVVGRTLSDLRRDRGPVAEGFLRRVAREVARGLAAIHERGVVHGDVKPENVLLTRDEVVKVMDLGLARLRDRSLRSGAGASFSGSLLYAAPEQFCRTQDDADGRIDLFALGVTIYELAAGRHPWYCDGDSVIVPRQVSVEAPRLRSVRPDVSPFLDEVVHALIDRDRDRRIRSAAELAAILAAAEEGAWFRGRRAGETAAGEPVRRESRLHGREEETAELWRLARLAREGRGSAVLLEGEPGSGKTRLLHEFAETAAARGLLGRVAWREFGPGRAGAQVVSGLDSLGAGAVAVLDGAEHADAEGWAAVSAFAVNARGRGVLAVVVAAEPPPLARREMLGDEVVRVRLGPLSVAAIGEVASDVLLAGRAGAGLVALLASRSGGQPGPVLAWMRALLAANVVRAGETGLWCPDPAAWSFAAPDDVLTYGAHALRDVLPDDRDLLEACACAGPRFDPVLVGTVVSRPLAEVEARMGVLSRRAIVTRAADERWAFGSVSVFEALRAGLSESLRAEYARAYADALLARSPRTPSESAELLRHAASAGGADVPHDDVCHGLAHLDAQQMHSDVVAVTAPLLAACGDPRTRRELRLRRGLSLLALGLESDGVREIREACIDGDAAPPAPRGYAPTPPRHGDDRRPPR